MYGAGGATVLPSTGVGITAGAAAFAGYTILAFVLAAIAAALFGLWLVRTARS